MRVPRRVSTPSGIFHLFRSILELSFLFDFLTFSIPQATIHSIIMSWTSQLKSKNSNTKNIWELGSIPLGEEVGEGATGRVFKGMFHDKLVAIKQFKKTPAYSDSMLLREANFLKQLGTHKNIVAFEGNILNQRALVFEFCGVEIDGKMCSNLKSILQLMSEIQGKHPVEPKIGFVKDILLGLQHLHDLNVIHCDIKPQNILVDGNPERMTCKLTDFGSNLKEVVAHYSVISTTANDIKGTAPYMAPELCPPCDPKVRSTKETDIYAFGVTTYEIFMPKVSVPWCNELPMESLRDPAAIYLKVKNGARPCMKNLTKFYDSSYEKRILNIIDIISCSWRQEPYDRPNVSELQKKLDLTQATAALKDEITSATLPKKDGELGTETKEKVEGSDDGGEILSNKVTIISQYFIIRNRTNACVFLHIVLLCEIFKFGVPT